MFLNPRSNVTCSTNGIFYSIEVFWTRCLQHGDGDKDVCDDELVLADDVERQSMSQIDFQEDAQSRSTLARTPFIILWRSCQSATQIFSVFN